MTEGKICMRSCVSDGLEICRVAKLARSCPAVGPNLPILERHHLTLTSTSSHPPAMHLSIGSVPYVALHADIPLSSTRLR